MQKCECVLFFLVLMLSGFWTEGSSQSHFGVFGILPQWKTIVCNGAGAATMAFVSCALAGRPGEWEKKARKPFGAAMREAF